MKLVLTLAFALCAAGSNGFARQQGSGPATRPASTSTSAPATASPAAREEPGFFLHGAVKEAGRRKLVGGYSVLDLFADEAPPPGVQVDRVVLIHQDKRNPLVFDIDIRAMVLTGNTKDNLRILDGDIVYFIRR